LVEHFADYGFNKSHSAAYALVAYQTAYLKAHYRQEFMAALLTSVMGTSDKVGYYIEECRKMGIDVLPPDINASQAQFSVDKQAIRFGLAGVKNVGENAIDALISARVREGKFTSLIDFCTKVDMRIVNKRVTESLIKCGAFDSLGAKRSQLIAVLDQAVEAAALRQREKNSGQMGLFGEETLSVAEDIVLPDIAEMPKEQILVLEKEMTGFYITGHPLDRFRETLKKFSSISDLVSGNYSDGQMVRTAGLLTNSKRITTKSGGMMCFADIEDFTSKVELVIFPRIFEKTNRFLLPDTPVSISGRLNVSEDGVKVIADSIGLLDSNTMTSEVRVRIYKAQENAEVFATLKEIFSAHNGSTVVFLHLVDSKRVIKTEKKYWITPSSQAIDALEGILGKGAVNVI